MSNASPGSPPAFSFARVARLLLAGAALLIILWSFFHVGLRLFRGQASERKVTLTILHWGNNEEEAIVRQLVAQFEATHPDIRIHRLHASNYEPKLKTMFAAGTPPDLFYLSYDDVPQYAGMNLLHDITPYIDQEKIGGKAQWLDDFYPVLLDAFKYDGQSTGRGPLFGLPKDFTTWVMYVNVNLFKAAGVAVPYDGWSWDEYELAMRKIAAIQAPSDGSGRIYGGVLTTWTNPLRCMIWSHGGDLFRNGDFRDVCLEERGAQDTLEMIHRVRFADQSVFNTTADENEGQQLFYTGKVGCVGPLGRWMTPRYRSINPKEFEWDVVPVPRGRQHVTSMSTVAWTMASTTKHPREAFELMKFLCGPEGQRMNSELGLAISSLKSVAESEAFNPPGQRPAHSKIFLDEVPYMRLAQTPREPEFGRIFPQQMNKSIQLRMQTPLEAARAVKTQWLEELDSPLRRREGGKMRWNVVLNVVLVVGAALLGAVWWKTRREHLGALDRSQERSGWAFIMPWVIGFLALTLGPMVVSLMLSMTRWTAMTPFSDARWVGPGNYLHLFTTDRSFFQSLKVTVYYVVLAIPLGQAAALGVAMLMNAKVPGIHIFRTVFYVPSIITGVALGTLWLTIFRNEYGLLDRLLRPALAWLGTTPPDWFGRDAGRWGVPAYVVMSLWSVGGGMMLYLGALQSVPASLYEAARIDGAGKLRQFWNVTLPMLSPFIFFNLVMGIIWSFQIFAQAYVMGGRGTDDATLFYVLNLYLQAFEFHNMGYASAMAYVLFAIILILTALVFRASRKLVYYEGLKA